MYSVAAELTNHLLLLPVIDHYVYVHTFLVYYFLRKLLITLRKTLPQAFSFRSFQFINHPKNQYRHEF